MSKKRSFYKDIKITLEYMKMMKGPHESIKRGDSSPQYKALNILADKYGYTIDTLRSNITNTKRELRKLAGRGYEDKIL